MVRGGWVMMVAMIAVGTSGAALGQVTRVATFENYVEEQHWTSFTEPVSGITFRNPTGGTAFTIEYSTT